VYVPGTGSRDPVHADFAIAGFALITVENQCMPRNCRVCPLSCKWLTDWLKFGNELSLCVFVRPLES
jgi:hypothetical protein